MPGALNTARMSLMFPLMFHVPLMPMCEWACAHSLMFRMCGSPSRRWPTTSKPSFSALPCAELIDGIDPEGRCPPSVISSAPLTASALLCRKSKRKWKAQPICLPVLFIKAANFSLFSATTSLAKPCKASKLPEKHTAGHRFLSVRILLMSDSVLLLPS